jgi:hypothetical protein
VFLFVYICMCFFSFGALKRPVSCHQNCVWVRTTVRWLRPSISIGKGFQFFAAPVRFLNVHSEEHLDQRQGALCNVICYYKLKFTHNHGGGLSAWLGKPRWNHARMASPCGKMVYHAGLNCTGWGGGDFPRAGCRTSRWGRVRKPCPMRNPCPPSPPTPSPGASQASHNLSYILRP